MSLRSGTQKADKYGTPVTVTPTPTPRTPSPRAVGGTPTPPPPPTPRTPSPRADNGRYDPSINSGLVYNPFSEIGQVVYGTITDFFDSGLQPLPEVSALPEQVITLPSIYGGQYVPGVEPKVTTNHVSPPEQEVKCPANVQIVSNVTNVVAGEGEFNCATIERYTEDPDYRIVYMENGLDPTPEPEPIAIPYLVSANVKISFTSNIGGFSSSIPINDISELQILSNESNEWRYTLIGSSTNQPLMTLSGLINQINNLLSSVVIIPPIEPPVEEPPVTTDHIPPPDMPVEEPPMVTATEPGQINWIPEPFFSFINNVFRR